MSSEHERYEKHTFFARYLTNVSPLLVRAPIATTAFGVAGRVFTANFEIPRKLTIDRIAFYAAVGAGNIRVGLYGPATALVVADPPDLPDGLPLVVESASTAMGGGGNYLWVTVANTQINEGLYFAAVQGDDITGAFNRVNDGTYFGGYYDRGGGYGAFTTPCPAVGWIAAVPLFILRVKSVP